MDKTVIYDYLKDNLGIDEVSDNDYLMKDIRLSSKEIVDFAIFISMSFKVKIGFSKDIKLGEVFEKIKGVESSREV